MAPSAITPPVLTPTSITFPTSYQTSSTLGGQPNFHGYDHITWYVGNAKQAASYYTTRLGFRTIAYKGLETSSRYIASHVIGNGTIRFVLTSPLKSYASLDGDEPISSDERRLLKEMYQHLEKHGDAVKDVAFEVDNVEAVYDQAVEQGAVSVQEPRKSYDENGFVITAIIRTYGDTTHTLISRDSYTGVFLPGYKPVSASKVDPLQDLLPPVTLEAIDHCVGNQDWARMEEACEYYERCLVSSSLPCSALLADSDWHRNSTGFGL